MDSRTGSRLYRRLRRRDSDTGHHFLPAGFGMGDRQFLNPEANDLPVRPLAARLLTSKKRRHAPFGISVYSWQLPRLGMNGEARPGMLLRVDYLTSGAAHGCVGRWPVSERPCAGLPGGAKRIATRRDGQPNHVSAGSSV